MTIVETERLALRRFEPSDAPFVLRLLNEPSWIEHIGNKGVHTVDDATKYLVAGPIAMYERIGFGLYLVELKESREPIGMCGLIKRDFLEDVDIGFAFLPRYRGAGYAFEAAAAVLNYARTTLGLTRVVAITTTDNLASARLLEKLGLRFERMVSYPGEEDQLRLFARRLVE